MMRKEKSPQLGRVAARPWRQLPLPLACGAPLYPTHEKGVRRCEPHLTTGWGSSILDLAAVLRLLTGDDTSLHLSGLVSKEDLNNGQTNNQSTAAAVEKQGRVATMASWPTPASVDYCHWHLAFPLVADLAAAVSVVWRLDRFPLCYVWGD